jgi:hypothetical protein
MKNEIFLFLRVDEIVLLRIGDDPRSYPFIPEEPWMTDIGHSPLRLILDHDQVAGANLLLPGTRWIQRYFLRMHTPPWSGCFPYPSAKNRYGQYTHHSFGLPVINALQENKIPVRSIQSYPLILWEELQHLSPPSTHAITLWVLLEPTMWRMVANHPDYGMVMVRRGSIPWNKEEEVHSSMVFLRQAHENRDVEIRCIDHDKYTEIPEHMTLAAFHPWGSRVHPGKTTIRIPDLDESVRKTHLYPWVKRMFWSGGGIHARDHIFRMEYRHTSIQNTNVSA